MTATMTMTMAPPSYADGHTACCPSCGYAQPVEETQAALLEAQKRISDLEAQVRLLNQKAAAAVDRWADYEDELARLRAIPSPPQPSPRQESPTRSSFLSSGAANRISALLSPRKSTPNLRTPPPTSAASSFPPLSPTPSNATTEDLLEALNREQGLRLAAESRLSTTSKEVEELSVSLFEQANEMVATERRARAKLEERVGVLEKREVDKKRRLDRLESAVGRIERVRSLLGEEKREVKHVREASMSEDQ